MSRSDAVRRFRLAGLCAAMLLVAFSLTSVADAQLAEAGEVSTVAEVEVTAPAMRPDQAEWVVGDQPVNDPPVAQDTEPSGLTAREDDRDLHVSASPAGAPPPLRGPPDHATS